MELGLELYTDCILETNLWKLWCKLYRYVCVWLKNRWKCTCLPLNLRSKTFCVFEAHCMSLLSCLSLLRSYFELYLNCIALLEVCAFYYTMLMLQIGYVEWLELLFLKSNKVNHIFSECLVIWSSLQISSCS